MFGIGLEDINILAYVFGPPLIFIGLFILGACMVLRLFMRIVRGPNKKEA